MITFTQIDERGQWAILRTTSPQEWQKKHRECDFFATVAPWCAITIPSFNTGQFPVLSGLEAHGVGRARVCAPAKTRNINDALCYYINVMSAETEQTKDFVTLYRRAFKDYGCRALWNVRELENPTPQDVLAITGSLRVEGDLKARRLAEQIEKVCRAIV